jgi:DNA-binding transcriptional MocR family regulator
MTEWMPILPANGEPRYLALVRALEGDITSGRVKVGARLLPQREMASKLGLSVGTISKAYAEAMKRGLISGEVGRGTFVLRRRLTRKHRHGAADGNINLALNVPPDTGEDELISTTLAEIIDEGELANLLGYLPHLGIIRHREAIATWLASLGVAVDADALFITHGGQHGLSVALSLLASTGDTILTESFSYSGIFALSGQCGYRLHGVPIDANGIVPEALDRAFAETRARALYCMPTLHTPTGSVTPLERRREIAAVIRKHDAFLLEDDAYSFLLEAPPTPVSTLIPERSFYVVSFAKCLAPGLRIAGMVVPEKYRDRANNAVRATGWMAGPVMAEVVSRLIRNGGLAKQARLKREQAVLRNEVARRVLKGCLPESNSPPGFHIWLPIPAGRTLTALIAEAAHAQITLAPPEGSHLMERKDLGVRLCLGGVESEADLEAALVEIRRILEMTESISLV